MSERTPEQVAHEQAMIKKVDDMEAALQTVGQPELPLDGKPPADQPTQASARPENIPEQFWDADKGQVNQEALLKAYQEATAGKQEATEGDPPADAQAAAEKAVQDAGLNMPELQAEFDRDGKLSDASYDKLVKSGIPRELVDAHIAGMEAIATQMVSEAYSVAGGEEAFKSMVQWAGANADPESIDAFNKAMMATPGERKQAIVALRAQYEAARGSDPKLTSGTSAQGSGERPFASRAEVVAAMSDHRYANDPAYRAMVARRVDAMDNF